MVRLPHRLFRILQLLALFQLLGGQLVIGSLFIFAKMTRHEHVSLATLPGQVWRAADLAHAWKTGQLPAPYAIGSSQPARPDSLPRPTAPTNQSKASGSADLAKIAGTFSPSVPTAEEHLLPAVAPPSWSESRVRTYAQPPPRPPPRAV